MVLKVVSSAGGGSSGFPITLGNTTIAAGSTTTTLGNLTLNNVTINGTTENNINFSNVNVTSGNIANTTLTNDTYVNANITSVAVAFPNSFLANSAVTLGNTSVSLGGTAASIGNLTLANVTIISGTVPAANVTGLGTMATQNANAVAITGGNTSVTYDNAVYQISTANIAVSSNVGAFSYGNLSYADVGIVASFANPANSSTQVILQNSSSANNASSDYVAVNDTGSVYADFGVTSSTYVGTGNFYKANSAYFYGGGSDVYIGSISNNAVHFVANNSTTDAMVLNANNTVTINAYSGTTNANATFNTSSLPLVPLGYLVLNINGTNYKIPYYNV